MGPQCLDLWDFYYRFSHGSACQWILLMKLAVDPLALQPRVTDDSIPWLTRVMLPRSDAQTDSLPIWSHWRLIALVLSEPRTLHCWQTPRRCYLWCPKDFPWKSQLLHDLRCPLLSGPITPEIFSYLAFNCPNFGEGKSSWDLSLHRRGIMFWVRLLQESSLTLLLAVMLQS